MVKMHAKLKKNPVAINLKSDNLQYNTLACWFAGKNDSSTKCLMYYFFHNFLQNYFQKSFQFIFNKNKEI